MADDPVYGEFWQLIYDEYQRSKDMILEITGYEELMQDSITMKASIQVREKIVLPLLTIQQYALLQLQKLNKGKDDPKKREVLERMVTRSLYGNINASRNSA